MTEKREHSTEQRAGGTELDHSTRCADFHEQTTDEWRRWHRRAWRRWPKAAWINGSGPYALVAHCRVPTVTLWESYALANAEKKVIDKSLCGGNCGFYHEIVDLRHRKAPGSQTLKRKVQQGKCCIPYCAEKATYEVWTEETYLGLEPEPNGPYGKCPLICERHAQDYELVDREGRMPSAKYTLVKLEDGGMK